MTQLRINKQHFLIVNFITILILSVSNFYCASKKVNDFKPIIIYNSKHLIITQVAENSFIHTSYKQTTEFGNVPCNGLIVRSQQEVIIFDTPTNDSNSTELINWVYKILHCKINAVVPTHFHDDCLGGLKAFHDYKIPSFANNKTTELAKNNNLEVPQNSFTDSINLKLGIVNASAKFFGEGHTKDNVVAYFSSDHILFGGCLVKELNASKGYLGDANVSEWSYTVEKVKQYYPMAKIIVPGHGKHGNQKLLDYTIQLFKNK